MSSNPEIDSIQSSDGVPYDARRTPSTVTLDVESHSVHTKLEQRDGFLYITYMFDVKKSMKGQYLTKHPRLAVSAA